MVDEVDFLIKGFRKVSIQQLKSVAFPPKVKFALVKGSSIVYLDRGQSYQLLPSGESVRLYHINEIK